KVAAGLPPQVEVALCPPATLLAPLSWVLKDSRVRTGGQDCHAKAEGAFTGNVSAAMLKAAGASFAIVGHSERRQYHRETNADIKAKAAAALAEGLIPVLCIGESEQERKSGQAEAVVGRQVEECLPEGAGKQDFLLAYEPVWAIGSGATPSVDDIASMHHHIMAVAAARMGIAAGAVQVLYGGSVKGANSREILHTPGVAGVLVGGASLKADEFGQIMLAAI
ncbi:MAG: triose-phosphate isomerase, partial [Proteobacteria bacterium]|nr:triose-phosphate isomerase [Pseudomonadota bacterium]